MMRDAEIHAKGCFSSEERHSISASITKQIANKFVDEVELVVADTIKEMIE
jgi:hypothetical protein